ncbi:MAG: TetR/AcrR family transcriptional regulator [Crocinitomicaceae bacterium]
MLIYLLFGNFFYKKCFHCVFCFYICPVNDKKINFLLEAVQVYMRFGIKSVTMDELARQLGISKKTIYTFVKDKNELVEQCLQLSHDQEQCDIKDISEKFDNAIDELLAIGELVTTRLRSIHPSIFFDIQKYHPGVLKKFEAHKNTFVKGCIISNLEKGKKQGLYRNNLNVEIIAGMYLSFIDVLFQGNTFDSHTISFYEIYSEYFRYHIRGISSKAGLAHLQKVIDTNNYDL